MFWRKREGAEAGSAAVVHSVQGWGLEEFGGVVNDLGVISYDASEKLATDTKTDSRLRPTRRTFPSVAVSVMRVAG